CISGLQNPNVLAVSPDGKTLAVGEAQFAFRSRGPYAVVLFEMSTGKELGRFLGFGDGVTALAFLPSGKRLLSADAEGSVCLHNLPTGQIVSRLKGPGV